MSKERHNERERERESERDGSSFWLKSLQVAQAGSTHTVVHVGIGALPVIEDFFEAKIPSTCPRARTRLFDDDWTRMGWLQEDQIQEDVLCLHRL